jgi:hypothetical protein
MPCHHPQPPAGRNRQFPALFCVVRKKGENVASVCFKCFRCFRGMLQLFHIDVAKVYQNVAYVAMVVHVCCKLLFPKLLYLFFQTCVASVFIWVLHIIFTHMLHVFHLDIAYILQWPFQAFLGVFISVSNVCCKCFNCFESML